MGSATATLSIAAAFLLAHLVPAVLVLVGGFIIIKIVMGLVKKLFAKTNKLDPIVCDFTLKVLNILLWTIVLLTLLKQLGVDITSFLTVFAAAGAAVALALKDSLGNLAGGILIMFNKPFGKGDYISCCGNEGFVQTMDLLFTTVLTIDNKTISIPNGQIANNALINFTKEDTRRVDVSIGIAYESDIEKARETVLALAANDPKFLTSPAAVCFVQGYSDHAIELIFRGWCKTADYWDVWFNFHNNLKPALDAAQIAIPFPQMDVHVDNKQ